MGKRWTAEELEESGFVYREDSYYEYVFTPSDYANSDYLVSSDTDETGEYDVYFNNGGESLLNWEVQGYIGNFRF